MERHLELLEYILETGNVELLGDPKISVLTPKYRWIIESTFKSKWFLLRSYFFKAKSEIKNQFNRKEGTRKYWEEVKLKKIKIFEQCIFLRFENLVHKKSGCSKTTLIFLSDVFAFFSRTFRLCHVAIVTESLLSLKYLFPIEERQHKSTAIIQRENKNIKDKILAIQNSHKLKRLDKEKFIRLLKKTQKIIPLLTEEKHFDLETKNIISDLTNRIKSLTKNFPKNTYPPRLSYESENKSICS